MHSNYNYQRGTPSHYGNVRNNKFVDVNGRLVTTVEDEDTGEIYISLSELKKSGFELFQAGTIPKPGGLFKLMTELQLNQFELYMKTKATKYLSRTLLELQKDKVDTLIKQEKDHFQLISDSDRRVSYSGKGNISITAKVGSPVNAISNNSERNSPRTNYNKENSNHDRENSNYNRNNSNRNRQSPNQQSNNYRSSNNERNNTHSNYSSSSETAATPSNSRNFFQRREEPRPLLPEYSNRKQQGQSNSYCSTRAEPISDKLPSKPQDSVPFKPVVHSEVGENNIHKRTIPSTEVRPNGIHQRTVTPTEARQDSTPQRTVTPTEARPNNTHKWEVLNSNLGNGSSMVSSTPVASPKSIPTEQAKVSNRKCVTDTVSLDGMFDYISTIDDNTIIAFTVPLCYTDQLAMLEDIGKETQIDVTFKPAVGDLIAAFDEKTESYVRGIVQKIVNSNYMCSLVDFGIIVTTANIRPLPKKFSEIPEFACCVTGSTEDIKEIQKSGLTISMDITAPGKLCVKIEETKKKYELQAKIWDPLNGSKAENPKPMPIFKLSKSKSELKTGDIVIIDSQVDGSLIVRTRECTSLLKEVNQAIQQHQAEAMTVAPVNNQLVLCPYTSEDGGNLYRAEVLSVKGEFAQVRYADYGDSDEVPVSVLKTVNERLANISNTFIAITLEEFTDKTFTSKQLTLLEKCCNSREKFTAVNKGVSQVFDLELNDKTSLSKKLIELEKPPAPPVVEPVVVSVSKPSQSGKKYNALDLKNCHLNIGLNDVMCVHSGDIGDGVVSFCPTTAIDRLAEITTNIDEHVSRDHQSYEPGTLELCVAKYEDEWFRGIALESGDEQTSYVLFMDYGNASWVKHSEIRKISDELVTYETCAATCSLKDIDVEEGIKEPMLSKLSKHIQDGEDYQINVISVAEDVYTITIPSVYEKLKKEGVL